jgi:hypothetical protein
MAFWLITVIQPCCDSLADGTTTVALSDYQPESDGHSHKVPACPELTALGSELTNTLPASSGPAPVVIAHSAGAVGIVPAHDAADQRSSYSSPPPRLAIYLSTSRLLI